jgi:hypothetical protein
MEAYRAELVTWLLSQRLPRARNLASGATENCSSSLSEEIHDQTGLNDRIGLKRRLPPGASFAGLVTEIERGRVELDIIVLREKTSIRSSGQCGAFSKQDLAVAGIQAATV